MTYLQQHHGIINQWMEKFSTIVVNELAKVSILIDAKEKIQILISFAQEWNCT